MSGATMYQIIRHKAAYLYADCVEATHEGTDEHRIKLSYIRFQCMTELIAQIVPDCKLDKELADIRGLGGEMGMERIENERKLRKEEFQNGQAKGF